MRRRASLGRGAARLLAAGLIGALTAACADDPQPVNEVVFAPAGSVETPAEPVAQVTALEIGVAHRGLVLAAFGEAEGDGWRAARLRPRTGAPGPDGAIEFELVAQPPALRDPARRQRLRADTPLAPEQLAGARSVRVIAAGGALERRLP